MQASDRYIHKTKFEIKQGNIVNQEGTYETIVNSIGNKYETGGAICTAVLDKCGQMVVNQLR